MPKLIMGYQALLGMKPVSSGLLKPLRFLAVPRYAFTYRYGRGHNMPIYQFPSVTGMPICTLLSLGGCLLQVRSMNVDVARC